MSSYKIQIYQAQDLVQTLTLNELVIVGRRDSNADDPLPIKLFRTNDSLRLVVADQHVDSIPRTWFSVIGCQDGIFEIYNLHDKYPVSCSHEVPLAVGQRRTFGREVLIDLGNHLALRISPEHLASSNDDDDEYRTLQSIPPTPGNDLSGAIAKTKVDFAAPLEANIENLLRVALGVVQQAAGSDAFFQTAVAATTQIVNLDRTFLILNAKANDVSTITDAYLLADGWCVVATHTNNGRSTIESQRPSSSLLYRVVESRSTVIHDPSKARANIKSLENIECAVASPVLNQNRDVIDHALRAIEAARAMLGAIETLRDRWRAVLPNRFGAGIGVNTGPAQVGNVGSRQKFKYGPLGNTVNLGSRLRSATKQLGVDCVVGHETVRVADCLSSARRIAKLGVAGIARLVDVYEIVQQSSAAWKELTDGYQLALIDFESQRFREAAPILGAMLPRFPDDRPSRKLLTRVFAEMDEPTVDFTGVWRLTSK